MYRNRVSPMKPLLVLFMVSLPVLLTGCWPPVIKETGSSPVAKATVDIGREQLGVSILAVNLFNIMNMPESPSGVPWQTRYTRIFTWMKDTGTYPDIIALQEAPGFWSCPTDARRLPDYAAIDFLLDGIREASGEQYRIAYLIGWKPGGASGNAWVGRAPGQFCSQQGGLAMLYRPSRVRNVITRPGAQDRVISPYVDPFPLGATYLARSIQCCSPAADRTDVCQVIDGPLDTPQPGHFELFMGTCPTPLGVAWTRSRRSMQGDSPDKPWADAVFSRFELISQPGNYIHIYNVHRGWGVDTTVAAPDNSGHANIDQLVTDMEGRFFSQNNPPLYPPILVGDMNLGMNQVDAHFPRFEVGMWGSPYPEVMGALFGKSTIFPAKQKAYANAQLIMPSSVIGEDCYRDQGTLWSDHCGIFFRVEPSRR